MRGRPLAARLAAVMAAVVVVVLLLAGVVVNRAASRGLDETLGPREEQRLGLAAAIIEEGLERGVDHRGLEMLLGRVAGQTGGLVRVVGADGSVLFEAGRQPPGVATETHARELSDAAGGGSLQISIPNARAPFLTAFNTALLATGAASVGALLVAAALLSRRMTRPLRAVAQAAHRLGSGDLTARASGGPDAESAELAVAFNGMADRLERSEVLRRRAASDLAHDLATPATLLESQLQAILDGVVPADPEQLERARTAAAALSGVILQLGELTQAEAAPLQRQPEPIDLRDLAAEIADGVEGLARQRGVTVSVEGSPAWTVADRGQLARAIRNVVTNAIQHSPRSASVTIAVAAESDGAVVRVRDAGPGVDAADLPFIFERFYRADRSRGGTRPGSGIGLTVARELIGANGGTIEVEATGPGATTFRVQLPRS
jgi:two-component system sensor histidine kinase BaeS